MMRLKYKGILKEKQLPKWTLPENAVRVNEPESFLKITLVSLLFVIPALVLVAAITLISYIMHGEHTSSGFSWFGLALSFLAFLPHEYLHAICFGKNAEVEMYFLPKSGNFAVTSAKAVSKSRFILLSLLPSIVLGWIPLLVWAILPFIPVFSTTLYTFAVITASVHPAGDYFGVYNILRQVPKGAMLQMSGNNPYWFIPDSLCATKSYSK